MRAVKWNAEWAARYIPYSHGGSATNGSLTYVPSTLERGFWTVPSWVFLRDRNFIFFPFLSEPIQRAKWANSEWAKRTIHSLTSDSLTITSAWREFEWDIASHSLTLVQFRLGKDSHDQVVNSPFKYLTCHGSRIHGLVTSLSLGTAKDSVLELQLRKDPNVGTPIKRDGVYRLLDFFCCLLLFPVHAEWVREGNQNFYIVMPLNPLAQDSLRWASFTGMLRQIHIQYLLFAWQ